MTLAERTPVDCAAWLRLALSRPEGETHEIFSAEELAYRYL
jgi:hypothetical protein